MSISVKEEKNLQETTEFKQETDISKTLYQYLTILSQFIEKRFQPEELIEFENLTISKFFEENLKPLQEQFQKFQKVQELNKLQIAKSYLDDGNLNNNNNQKEQISPSIYQSQYSNEFNQNETLQQSKNTSPANSEILIDTQQQFIFNLLYFVASCQLNKLMVECDNKEKKEIIMQYFERLNLQQISYLIQTIIQY